MFNDELFEYDEASDSKSGREKARKEEEDYLNKVHNDGYSINDKKKLRQLLVNTMIRIKSDNDNDNRENITNFTDLSCETENLENKLREILNNGFTLNEDGEVVRHTTSIHRTWYQEYLNVVSGSYNKNEIEKKSLQKLSLDFFLYDFEIQSIANRILVLNSSLYISLGRTISNKETAKFLRKLTIMKTNCRKDKNSTFWLICLLLLLKSLIETPQSKTESSNPKIKE